VYYGLARNYAALVDPVPVGQQPEVGFAFEVDRQIEAVGKTQLAENSAFRTTAVE
jgi:hypothetical protein